MGTVGTAHVPRVSGYSRKLETKCITEDWRNIIIHFRVFAQLPAWGYQSGFIHCSVSGVWNTGDCLRRSANSSGKKSINCRHSDLLAT